MQKKDHTLIVERLQSLADDGILKESEAKEKIFMTKEQAVLKIHNRAISKAADGRSITKVLTNPKDKASIKSISGRDYPDLIKKLYNFYFGEQNASLANLFPEWKIWRRDHTKATNKTIKENIYLWQAYFEKSDIVQVPLRSITVKQFIDFFQSMTQNGTITRKRFNDAKSVLNSLYDYAIHQEIVSHNPLSEINYRGFTYRVNKSNVTPYTKEERIAIINYLANDKMDIYSLAIQFDFCLLLRIGELKALKWNNIIDNNYIYIGDMSIDSQTMNDDGSFNRRTHDFVERTKGNTSEGKRTQPLVQKAKEILIDVKKINPNSEYIFLNNGQPLVTTTFNRRLKKCCEDLGIPYRSSHKIRFSTASIMYENDVKPTEIQKLLGHTTLAMTLHYLRSNTPPEETKSVMENIFG